MFFCFFTDFIKIETCRYTRVKVFDSLTKSFFPNQIKSILFWNVPRTTLCSNTSGACFSSGYRNHLHHRHQNGPVWVGSGECCYALRSTLTTSGRGGSAEHACSPQNQRRDFPFGLFRLVRRTCPGHKRCYDRA